MDKINNDAFPTCGRRTFFKALFQEAMTIQDAFKGKPSYRLSSLGELPDAQLAQIKPSVDVAWEIFVERGYVWGRFKSTDHKVCKLFSTDQENLTVFNMFNGKHSLRQISQRVAERQGWDEAKAFAHTKAIFIHLVNHLVCVPQNCPLDE